MSKWDDFLMSRASVGQSHSMNWVSPLEEVHSQEAMAPPLFLVIPVISVYLCLWEVDRGGGRGRDSREINRKRKREKRRKTYLFPQSNSQF